MLKLKRLPNNPILTPESSHPWEAQAAFNGCPIVSGDTTHLVYRALSFNQHFAGQEMEVSTVGYAQSKHGGPFTNRRQLITPQESWEQYGCEDPRITKIDDTYYICYTALSTFPFNAAGIKIAMAATQDFETIERHLVTPFNAKAMALFHERINGEVVAIFTSDSDIPPSSICIAKAKSIEDFWSYDYWDNWYVYKLRNTLPLLRSLADHIEVGAPPLKTKEGWLVVYSYISAYLTNTKVFSVEAVLLDLDDPVKILCRLPYSLLESEAPYEKTGVIDNIVFPSGLLLNEDTLSLYYGGADTVCAVATCSLEELLKELKKHPFT